MKTCDLETIFDREIHGPAQESLRSLVGDATAFFEYHIFYILTSSLC